MTPTSMGVTIHALGRGGGGGPEDAVGSRQLLFSRRFLSNPENGHHLSFPVAKQSSVHYLFCISFTVLLTHGLRRPAVTL